MVLKFLLFLTFFCSVLICQQNTFKNPIYSDNITIFTDSTYSNLYKIQNNELTLLHSSPGCGYYISLSPNSKFIGFK